MITVTALGALDVRDAARGSLATLLAQPRRAALLVYLIVEGGDRFVSRETLLGVFWPESDESRGRGALRQALAFLRRTLGEDAITTRGDDGVGVDPETVRCDVPSFLAALQAGEMTAALSLYRGEFLAGLLIDEAPAFDQWSAAQRESLARRAADAAGHAAEYAAARGDWSEAIARARQAQAFAPRSEEHHRRLLSCLAGAGERATALEEHTRFAARLAEDLEVVPSPATLALVATLRQPPTVGVAVRPSSSVSPPASLSPATPPSAVASGASRWASAEATADSPGRVTALRATTWIAASVIAVAVVAVSLLAVVTLRPNAGRGAPAETPATVSRSGPERMSPSRVLVLPLTDETRDTSLTAVGRLAADWITEGIARVEGIEVVPMMAVLTTERGLPSEPGRGTSARWQQVARDVGAGVVVRGAVYREQRMLELQAQVLDAATGRVLLPVERVRTPVDSVIAGVDRLRTRVVAALAPLADTVTHLRRALAPPTYESYRLYVAGLETFVNGDARGALSLFTRSAGADSTYPMPRIAATIMYLNLTDATSAERLLVSLRAERDRLGPLEQSTLDMTQGLLAGDLAATYDAVVRQARIAPGTIGEYMVAEIARKMNRPLEAVRVLRALGPDHGELRGWSAYWRELTFALHMLSRHDEELAAAREAERRYPTDPFIAQYRVRAHAAQGDRAGMQVVLRTVASSRSAYGSGAALRLIALTEWLAHGHAGGPALASEVVAWFDSLPAAVQDSARIRQYRARALLLADRPEQARLVLQPLLARGATPSFSALGLAGVSAAAIGDRIDARRWMATIASRARALTAPERGLSWGESSYWSAVIAAACADSSGALDLLRQARREGMGMEPTVHAEPAFAALRGWAPFAALLSPEVEGDSGPRAQPRFR